MRRKHHERLPRESLDEPFGPPPEEYLYRCPVCSEEMLVNEAVIPPDKCIKKTVFFDTLLIRFYPHS